LHAKLTSCPAAEPAAQYAPAHT